MATFWNAQKTLLEEVKDRIVSIEPEFEEGIRFKPRPPVNKELGDLVDEFIAPRQFEVRTPGRKVEEYATGYGFIFPLYEYDIVIQYPIGEEWTQACHSDVTKITRDLINNHGTVSGVQLRFIRPDNPIEPIIDDEDSFMTVVFTMVVYYEVTG